MKLPEIVYHGTFFPEGRELNPDDHLVVSNGYVSTTEVHGWARYFAGVKRYQFAGEAGILTIYYIDTSMLPLDVVQGCIPPEEYDPRAKMDKNLLREEKELRADRIRMKEWRFPYIPLPATRSFSSYKGPESEFISAHYALLSYHLASI